MSSVIASARYSPCAAICRTADDRRRRTPVTAPRQLISSSAYAELKPVNNGEADVMVPQLHPAAGAKFSRHVITDIHVAQIDVLVLASHAQVTGKGILQTASDVPADIRVILAAGLA